ncbi:MAG: DUF2628 domain-containing protein [Nitrospira sp.]|nr:DUF2628 domain-containing protein [Nitrospira sp.]
MKKFKIFKHSFGMMEVVKQGWSWPACCFNIFWALAKQMWVLGAGSLVAWFSFLIIGPVVLPDLLWTISYFIVSIGIGVVFGINGNDWREQNLVSRGFQYQGTVAAADSDSAIATFAKGDLAVVV